MDEQDGSVPADGVGAGGHRSPADTVGAGHHPCRPNVNRRSRICFRVPERGAVAHLAGNDLDPQVALW
jgi:hypothetical protein